MWLLIVIARRICEKRVYSVAWEHETRSYKNDREHAIAEHLIVNNKIVTFL